MAGPDDAPVPKDAPVPPTTRCGGVVLAGGAGRRFGAPKATVTLAGRTLVARAVDTLRERCGGGPIVVVSRAGVDLGGDIGAAADVAVVLDRRGPDAVLNAVLTGLAALAERDDLQVRDAFVLACDLPLAGPALGLLAEAPPGLAVCAIDADPRAHGGVGRPQPLCARYPLAETVAAAERLMAVGALPVRGLLDAVHAAGVPAPPGTLLNVNRSADLAAAERALAAGRG